MNETQCIHHTACICIEKYFLSKIEIENKHISIMYVV